MGLKNEPLSLSLFDPDQGDVGEGNYSVEGSNGRFKFDEESLSKHFLFLGSPGSGKTNAIFQFVDVIKNKMMTDDDAMIIFDTKGDYKSHFFNESRYDIIVSNLSSNVHWNLFDEISYDPKELWDVDAYEISLEIFDEALKRSKEAYFPMAAADVTSATLSAILRGSEKSGHHPTNQDLLKVLGNGRSDVLIKIIEPFEDLLGAIQHIAVPNSSQTQGVMGLIRQVVQSILSGEFGKEGNFSIRKFVEERGKRTLFIEYDTSYGRFLTPIYRLMIDMAIKEGLSSKKPKKGSIFFVIDEFGLLPNLFHIENAINFGRQQGIKLLVGSQNVNQISDSYGEERANSILASFGTLFGFRLNDELSKRIISSRYGEYLTVVNKASPIPTEPLFRTIVSAQVIEPLLLSLLKTGQSLVCISGSNPRLFQFKKVLDSTFKSMQLQTHVVRED